MTCPTTEQIKGIDFVECSSYETWPAFRNCVTKQLNFDFTKCSLKQLESHEPIIKEKRDEYLYHISRFPFTQDEHLLTIALDLCRTHLKILTKIQEINRNE